MSGHSKWATTKRAKAVTDAKRGAIFTKISNTIAVAVKEHGADPAMNFKLRLALEQAKAANMPKDVIERAIKRASGEGGEVLEEALYEAFGPGGTALVIEILTSNRNRATSELRHLFNEYGGNLGESGTTQWMFDHKGVIRIANCKLQIVSLRDISRRETNFEEFELKIIDAGAEDIQEEQDGSLTIVTIPDNLQKVKECIEAQGIKIEGAYLGWFPKNPVALSDPDRAKLQALEEALEEHQDVKEYYTNVL
jgi:YebC/PmpR family DNA-binding regulatory protein